MFTRITINPEIHNGQPCIRGMRVPVHLLLDLLAAGKTVKQILEDYNYLEEKDIQEAIAYASYLAREETIELRSKNV